MARNFLVDLFGHFRPGRSSTSSQRVRKEGGREESAADSVKAE